MMNGRILVAYASKAGSTAEIAKKIAQTLSERNVPVDVLPAGKVNDLSPYSAVVLGSAIRMGAVLPEAVKFIEKNQAALQQKPFSMFIACMTLHEDNEENRKTVSAYLAPVRALVKPDSEGLFAGVIDPSKVGLLERMAIKLVKSPLGDFRKWDEISAWAESIPLG
ncbi:MAG: flavodoxin [Chloroflexi bacterium]|nr:flavodoxin [Chloroflexota bacterium]